MTGDDLFERLGRWTAQRTTRRSFLGRLGRGAVFVASGPTLALLLADEKQAAARVCGQSGVSVRCANFDCVGEGEVWGWCWYASGCCAGGGLKKICDCCAVNWPNVHGYCPHGTNVKCIVESCGADPRVMTTLVTRIAEDEAVATSIRVSQARFPGGAPAAVLSDAEDAVAAAVATPVAYAVGGPLLLTGRQGLDARVAAELRRLGAGSVTVAGPSIRPDVDADVAEMGLAVGRLGFGPDLETFSVEVADWLRPRTQPRKALCLVNAGVSAAAAPCAAAVAMGRGYPVLVGRDAAVAAADPARPDRAVLTYMVGPEAAAFAGEVPGGHPIRAGLLEQVSTELARLAVEGDGLRGHLALAPTVTPGAAMAMAGFGGPLLLHPPGSLHGVREWLFAHRGPHFGAAYAAGTDPVFGPGTYYELQAILNEFETHLLIGTAGQGLPVIPQPPAEQPVGRARRASVGSPSGYWVGRANPDRD